LVVQVKHDNRASGWSASMLNDRGSNFCWECRPNLAEGLLCHDIRMRERLNIRTLPLAGIDHVR